MQPSDLDAGARRPARGEAPVYDYAAEVITPRLEKMLSHLEGVRQGTDIEPVHQMRVWSRRTRAALDIFHSCFPGKAFARIEEEVKAMTRALGAARDLDVMIENLQKRAEALPLEQRAGLDAFIGRLKTQRKVAQKAVEKAVARLERKRPGERFAALLAEAPPAKTGLQSEERRRNG